jgi:hypothetical protein
MVIETAALPFKHKEGHTMRGALAVWQLMTALIVVASPAWAEGLKQPPIDFKAYYTCRDKEVADAVKRAVESGTWDPDLKLIGNHAIDVCAARFSNGIPVQQSDRSVAETLGKEALNALTNAYMERQRAALRKKVDEQAALDAPKLEAESAAASRLYGDCLFGHAKEIALISTESAEVVREAAFAACIAERNAITEIHRRYKDQWFDEQALDIADKRVAGALLLEIIKARAVGSPPPSPRRAPKPTDKSI